MDSPDQPGDRPTKQHDAPVIELADVSKTFSARGRSVTALDHVQLAVGRGKITGLIGPDGAGKTTLMRLATGLLVPDDGHIRVLGFNATSQFLDVQSRVGYMPQRFGLYEDLSVRENLDLYADLQGVPRANRAPRYHELMHMTGLAPFMSRLAGRLSGGMKQKLGLACTLVHPPELLLLDEPTVGVDPVSRRELWQIVYRLVREQGMTVLLSTAYLDEAERCSEVILLHQGRVLGQGTPESFSSALAGRSFHLSVPGIPKRHIQAAMSGRDGVIDAVLEGEQVRLVLDKDSASRPEPLVAQWEDARLTPAPPRFEDAFVTRIAGIPADASSTPVSQAAVHSTDAASKPPTAGDVIEVHNLERRFGDFYAVRNLSFSVRRGEIFGLLGANGAGKSTTFRMLCGLLPVSGGRARVAGVDLRSAAATARARIGYMSQKFSLYGNLSVLQNLHFFASAYGLSGKGRETRIRQALDEFALTSFADVESETLPLGYKQRLALACALLHEPEILFLDEPTSGVDPLARREFWSRINALADRGVTILVTTHFMEEAEYCDRMAIMAAGEILALGSPLEIKSRVHRDDEPEPTMEEAFIALIEQVSPDQEKDAGAASPPPSRPPGGEDRGKPKRGGSPMRFRGLVRKEFLQILRDPSSIAIAFLLPVVLLLLFGYGVSMDARHVPLATVVEQPDAATASLVGAFRESPYFRPVMMTNMRQAEAALMAGKVNGIVHLQADFRRRMNTANGAPIQLIVNGVDANYARLIEGYVQGTWSTWLTHWAAAKGVEPRLGVDLEPRIWFNPNLRSRDYLVPGLIVVIMTLIGALLTALVMAREWERGTMEALLITPVRIREVLGGKLVPYFVLGMGGMGLSVAMAVWLFEVPLRGSLVVLTLASSLFLIAALGMGLLISITARNQFVAGLIAIITTFLPAFILSGFIFDIGSMPRIVQILTHLIAARYFVAILQNSFLAGDLWPVLLPNAAALLIMATVFLGLSRRRARKRLE